jgi:hypothetical protein
MKNLNNTFSEFHSDNTFFSTEEFQEACLVGKKLGTLHLKVAGKVTGGWPGQAQQKVLNVPRL